MNPIEDLKARGFGKESSAPLETILGTKRGIYHGVDPTADSLHVGHLVPLLLMKRLGDLGHRTVFLVGGGTGMIGDPRDVGERTLLDKRTLEHNKKAIRAQLQKIMGKRIEMVDNASWLGKVGLLEFLRDIGKHFTVNELMKRELIKRRLEDPDESISFTEFSYSLLQGYDFLTLFKKKGIAVQVGGSDQWTNMLSGVELIRRKLSQEAYVFTNPLVTDAAGKKFGKSEGNPIWLDGKKTSPFDFYQFWMRLPDAGIDTYLKLYTFLPLADIETLIREHAKNPAERKAQKVLAREVTKVVHGEKGMQTAERETEAHFGADKNPLAKEHRDAFQKVAVVPGSLDSIVALAAEGFGISKSEARRLIENKGIRLNGETVVADRALADADFTDGAALMEKGKAKILITR